MVVNRKDTILVTGGKGFLGRAVCRSLKRRGYDNVVALPGSTNSFALNLTNPTNVTHVFDSYDPDVVIHLAARVGGIGANQESPGRFFYENMSMGLNVINESRRKGCKKLVLLSTVCSYPNHTPVPFKEEYIWNGYPEETNAPYGIAKKALMEMLSAYRKQYGFNGITLIPVNMYGPNDNFDPKVSHVIPALILKIQKAIHEGLDEVEVWGTGEASREFLYVDDCAEAIAMATEKYNKPGPVNIGTGREIKIRDLINTIVHIMDYQGKIVFDTSKPDGQPRRCLDVEKARDEFNFEATTPLEEGLYKTVEWFRNDYWNNFVQRQGDAASPPVGQPL